jgi:flagellin
MGLRIKTNVQSTVAQHRLHEAREALEHTQNKLASGSRIIKAMDDAAGLAISESLRSTLRSTGQNIKNTQDAFFMLQTADSAIGEITNIVIRMKELAVQAASDTNGDKERGYLDNEYQQLKLELNRISESAQFNGRPLLNGQGETIAIQVGPNNNANIDRIYISTGFKINADSLGIGNFAITDVEGARNTLEPIEGALDVIAKTRGAIGAGESRINTTLRSLMTYQENISGAYSQIRDADIALETSEFAKHNILSQSSVAVLAQANTIPSIALKLIGS